MVHKFEFPCTKINLENLNKNYVSWAPPTEILMQQVWIQAQELAVLILPPWLQSRSFIPHFKKPQPQENIQIKEKKRAKDQTPRKGQLLRTVERVLLKESKRKQADERGKVAVMLQKPGEERLKKKYSVSYTCACMSLRMPFTIEAQRRFGLNSRPRSWAKVQQTFSEKGQDSKYFRLCRQYGLCHSY